MNKVNQIITDRFIKALEEGTIPWEKPWTSNGLFPRNAITNKTYSGVNIMLLAMMPYENPFWLTYKQATKLGGSVKEGEKSTPVTFWKVMYFNRENDEKMDKSKALKWLKDASKKHKVRTVPILRYYNVFNIEQTEDIDPEKLPELPDFESYEHEPHEGAQAIIDAYLERENIPVKDDAIAAYAPHSDSLRMPTMDSFKEVPKYYGTFFHELIHSTGHKTRLNRDLTGNMRTESYSKEELTAEIGASFLNHQVGFLDNTIENSKAYIKSWLNRLRGDDGATYIIHAGARAEKAVEFILPKEDEMPEIGEKLAERQTVAVS